ncbi:MAG: iron-sulfur cluster assembly accessory protein, partial [Polyangiaceae bacterium]
METSSVSPAASQEAPSPSESPKSRREIIISDKAVEFAKKKLAQRGTPDAAVRLGVKGGGCSGFSYVIQYEDTPPKERDTVYDAGGVRFYVDKKSFVYLAGSVLDYEQTLMFQGF